MSSTIPSPRISERQVRLADRIRTELDGWLRGDAPVEQLVRWLRGIDLPPLDEEIHPYVWLYRALAVQGEREPLRRTLAQRCAELLSQGYDKANAPQVDSDLLFNLLGLCTLLREPSILAEPLWAMAARGEFSKEWGGGLLPHQLRVALAENQLPEKELLPGQGDESLKGVWVSMLDGKPHPALGGQPIDGFEGLRLLPRADASGLPNFDAIGTGLSGMARYLNGSTHRRAEFRAQIARAVRGRPDVDWARELVLQAHRTHWQRWAVQCLPGLFLDLGMSEDGTQRVLLWTPILDSIPSELPRGELHWLCDGEVADIALPVETYELASALARKIEPYRRSNPYESDRSVVASVAHALMELELWLERQGKSAAALHLWEVQQRLLDALLFPPDIEAVGGELQAAAVALDNEPEREVVFSSLCQVTSLMDEANRRQLSAQLKAMDLQRWARRSYGRVA